MWRTSVWSGHWRSAQRFLTSLKNTLEWWWIILLFIVSYITMFIVNKLSLHSSRSQSFEWHICCYFLCLWAFIHLPVCLLFHFCLGYLLRSTASAVTIQLTRLKLYSYRHKKCQQANRAKPITCYNGNQINWEFRPKFYNSSKLTVNCFIHRVMPCIVILLQRDQYWFVTFKHGFQLKGRWRRGSFDATYCLKPEFYLYNFTLC